MVQKVRRKKTIFVFMALLMTLSIFLGVASTANAVTPPFNDLAGYEWAWTPLQELKDAGIIHGNPLGGYDPSGTIIRADFAKVLCIAFKLPIDTYATSSFNDSDNPDQIRYIEAAKSYFYAPANTFRPDDNVTREEIANSLIKVLGLDVTAVDTAYAEVRYSKDWSTIDSQYKPAVALATNLGFVSGDGNGHFNPKIAIERVEMAVLLWRALRFGGGVNTVDGTTEFRFTDVKPGDWYFTAVMNLYNRGIMNGTSDNTFSPNDLVLNNQLPWLIARLLGRVTDGYDPMTDTVVTGIYLPAGFTSDTNDLERDTTAFTVAKLCNLLNPEPSVMDSILSQFDDDASIENRGEVAACVNAQYMGGIHDSDGDLIFDPDGAVTRAQIASLFVLALNKSTQVFTDVAQGDWYYDGVLNLYNRGIVRGFPNGTFQPNNTVGDDLAYLVAKRLGKTISQGYDPKTDSDVLDCFPNNTFSDTREAACYAALKVEGTSLTDVNYSEILQGYNDASQISTTCKPALAYLISIGALRGDTNGNLRPLDQITRGEFAVFYARLLNSIDTAKMNDYETTIEAVKNE